MKSLLRLALSMCAACILCGTLAFSAPAVKLHLSGFMLSTVNGREKETPVEKIALKKGDVVRYTILATNVGNTPAVNVKTIGPIPKFTQYVPGSASQLGGVAIEYTVDGKAWSLHPTVEVKTDRGTVKKIAEPSQFTAIRWLDHRLLTSHATLKVAYEVRVK